MRAHLSQVQSKPSIFEAFKGVFQSKNQQFALLLMIFLMLGQFTIVPFISPYMVANVGFKEDELTYIYLIGGACTIFTSPLIGKLADRIGRLRVFTISVWFSLIPLMLITHLGATPVGWVLLITAFFFVLIGGRMIPAMTMITSAVDNAHRGSFMSINSAVQQISSGAAAFLAGLIVTRNGAGELVHYQYVGYIALTFSLLTLLVAWRIRPISAS
jgi:predicted MFS family arabinose efflux permease